MSLIHWWPLNGNTNDLGILSLNLSGQGSIGFTDSGKIGKGASFTSDSHNLKATDLSTLVALTEYSMSCWVYLSNTATNHSSTFLSSGNWNSSDAQVCFGLYNYNSGYGTLLVPNKSGWSAGINLTTKIQLGVWHHYTVVYDGLTTRGYIDGIYVGSYNGGGISSTDVSYYYLGAATYYSGFTMKGVMNDFRIYDHALSAKEVKEISKGLVLHYNFEDEYIEPTTNLSTRNGCDGWANSGAATRTNNDTSLTAPEPSCPIYSITQTTAGQAAITFGTTSSSVPSKTLTASVWFYMSGSHTGSNNIGPYIRSNKTDGSAGTLEYKGDTNFRNWPNNRWIKLTKTFTTNSEETTLYFCAYSANLNEKFAFNGWQLEEKDHATPYVNGTRSVGKVYDNSGYGNNGTNNGIIISNDSISGKFSAQFASNAYIEIPSLPQFNKVTYSMWVKIPSNAQAYRSIFIPKGDPVASGIWLSVNTEGANLWAYQGGNAPSYCKGTSTPLSADTWYLYTHTFDGTTGQNYLNGVAVGSAATYTTRTYIPSGVYTLGDSYMGTTWGGTPFDGKIADFKIYATVLSAEDILSEYNRKAAIDRNGNLFTGEIEESNSTNINVTKTAIIRCNNIVEGTSNVKFLGGYTQLEYIEGTGMQYINSNYIPNINTTIVGRYMNTENAEDTPLFGTRTSNMTKSYTFWAHPSDHTNTSWYSQMIFNDTYANFSRNACKVHGEINSFYFSDTLCVINNERKTISVSSGTPDLSLIIFGLRNGSSIDSRKFIGRIYEFKIYEEKEVIRDFIPAKDKNGIIGMFDLVNKTFYTNAGSGTFIAGPEVEKINAIYANEIRET